MPQASAPIAQCPECRYELRGLPPPHRCPECGFEYDEHTRVWRPAKPWQAYFGVGLVVFSTPLFLGAAPWRLARSGAAVQVGNATLLCLALWLLAVIWLLLRARQANARGRYVAIAPRGIVARTTGGSVVIPWEAIRRIHERYDGRIHLECLTQQAAVASRHIFNVQPYEAVINRGQDASEFCEHVNAALARHRAAQRSQQ